MRRVLLLVAVALAACAREPEPAPAEETWLQADSPAVAQARDTAEVGGAPDSAVARGQADPVAPATPAAEPAVEATADAPVWEWTSC